MKKRLWESFLLAVLVSMVSLPMAYSEQWHNDKCHGCGLEKKIFHQLHSVIAHQEELKLSDKQLAKIKELKNNMRKNLIKTNADIDIVEIDIQYKLWDDAVDKRALHKLIEQKYNFKEGKAKQLIDTYIGLKEILSNEQQNKLKEITPHRGKMKGGKHSEMNWMEKRGESNKR